MTLQKNDNPRSGVSEPAILNQPGSTGGPLSIISWAEEAVVLPNVILTYDDLQTIFFISKREANHNMCCATTVQCLPQLANVASDGSETKLK